MEITVPEAARMWCLNYNQTKALEHLVLVHHADSPEADLRIAIGFLQKELARIEREKRI